MSHSNISLRF